jgi:hypothetical protein
VGRERVEPESKGRSQAVEAQLSVPLLELLFQDPADVTPLHRTFTGLLLGHMGLEAVMSLVCLARLAARVVIISGEGAFSRPSCPPWKHSVHFSSVLLKVVFE